MQLPKIQYPTFTINIPPNNQQVAFRPMLVREEKILLMAKQSEDPTQILSAIKQVVNNCSLDPAFIVDNIPLFALEFAFINLRGASIGNDIEVAYQDYDDQQTRQFKINLKDVKVKYHDPAPNHVIEITPQSGVVMKYPPAALYDDKAFLATDGEDTFYSLIIKCIDQVYDGEKVYNGQDFSTEDLAEFLELLDIASFDKMREFMLNLPTLYYKIEYKNANGKDQVIELTSLSDFFTLR